MKVDHIAKGPEQLWWAQTIFLVGLAFYLADLFLGGSMTPTTYGYMAYDIDARSWAQGFMAASAAVLFGLYINGRWPEWTPVMRCVGWSVLALMHILLAVSACLPWTGCTSSSFPSCSSFGGLPPSRF